MNDPISGRVTGVVLAGGRGRRFGGDKLAVRIGGVPLLELALRALASVCDELVLVVAASSASASTRLVIPDGLPIPLVVVADVEPDRGPLLGLATGLGAAHHPTVIVVGADMPGLVPEVVRLLVQRIAAGAPGAVLADGTGSRPLPLALQRDVGRARATDILRSGGASLRALVTALPASVVGVREWRALDPAAATLMDVDSPEDLAEARRLLHPDRG